MPLHRHHRYPLDQRRQQQRRKPAFVAELSSQAAYPYYLCFHLVDEFIRQLCRARNEIPFFGSAPGPLTVSPHPPFDCGVRDSLPLLYSHRSSPGPPDALLQVLDTPAWHYAVNAVSGDGCASSSWRREHGDPPAEAQNLTMQVLQQTL